MVMSAMLTERFACSHYHSSWFTLFPTICGLAPVRYYHGRISKQIKTNHHTPLDPTLVTANVLYLAEVYILGKSHMLLMGSLLLGFTIFPARVV
jgi:hypothetical protein